MKKIKIKLLYAHIKKIITAAVEVYNLPEGNATKKSLKSMGLINLAQNSSISDIEIIDTTPNRRIGLIGDFAVLDKGINELIENDNLPQGDYIAMPTLKGLIQLKTILENYVRNNKPYEEREVYFKIIATEGQAQIAEDFADDLSNVSGFSQLGNISNASFAGGTTQDTTALTEQHQAAVNELNTQITILTQDRDQKVIEAAQEKQNSEERLAQLTAEFQNLQLQKGHKDTEITNINTQLAQKTQQLANANNQLIQKNTQVTNANNQVNQITAQKNAIQGQLNNANAQLQTKTQQLATAQQNVGGNYMITTTDVNVGGQWYVRISAPQAISLSMNSAIVGTMQNNYFDVKSK